VIIIPRIEYQLAAIVLKKSECNKLMTRLNMIIKKRVSLTRSTSNFVIYEKDILGVKHIYDLQMEMLCKNLFYQANGNDKLKLLFMIKMAQKQKNIWTSKCLENNRNNNWILDALKTLNNENIKLCNHEINNNKGNHRIKEGKIDLIDLIKKKYISTSARSMKAKDVMLLEDILEVDRITLLKWKHLCKKKGVNTKGKVPKWFSDLERKLLDDQNRKIRKIKNEYIYRLSAKEQDSYKLF
jgi:hypothetical protein